MCRAAGREAIAQFARVSPAAVAARAATGNNAEPECRFTVRGPRGGRARVTVNIDSSPQAYQRLERAIVEAGQQFGSQRNFTAPVTVPRLGLDASWFPDQTKLVTTDGTTLITVVIDWPRLHPAQAQALAVDAARRYLGRLNPKAAEPTGS